MTLPNRETSTVDVYIMEFHRVKNKPSIERERYPVGDYDTVINTLFGDITKSRLTKVASIPAINIDEAIKRHGGEKALARYQERLYYWGRGNDKVVKVGNRDEEGYAFYQKEIQEEVITNLMSYFLRAYYYAVQNGDTEGDWWGKYKGDVWAGSIPPDKEAQTKLGLTKGEMVHLKYDGLTALKLLYQHMSNNKRVRKIIERSRLSDKELKQVMQHIPTAGGSLVFGVSAVGDMTISEASEFLADVKKKSVVDYYNEAHRKGIPLSEKWLDVVQRKYILKKRLYLLDYNLDTETDTLYLLGLIDGTDMKGYMKVGIGKNHAGEVLFDDTPTVYADNTRDIGEFAIYKNDNPSQSVEVLYFHYDVGHASNTLALYDKFVEYLTQEYPKRWGKITGIEIPDKVKKWIPFEIVKDDNFIVLVPKILPKEENAKWREIWRKYDTAKHFPPEVEKDIYDTEHMPTVATKYALAFTRDDIPLERIQQKLKEALPSDAPKWKWENLIVYDVKRQKVNKYTTHKGRGR
jgi:hypothetical protein